MFKKAGDNIHYLERTGSHATKGSGRGIDYVAPLAAEDFMSPQNILVRSARMRQVAREYKLLRPVMNTTNRLIGDAIAQRDFKLLKELRKGLGKLYKHRQALAVEMRELKVTTPLTITESAREFADRELSPKKKKATARERRAAAKLRKRQSALGLTE